MFPAVLMHHQNTLELTRSALVDMQEDFRTKNCRLCRDRRTHCSDDAACSVELALFELMRDAMHEQFRAIQGLTK